MFLREPSEGSFAREMDFLQNSQHSDQPPQPPPEPVLISGEWFVPAEEVVKQQHHHQQQPQPHQGTLNVLHEAQDDSFPGSFWVDDMAGFPLPPLDLDPLPPGLFNPSNYK